MTDVLGYLNEGTIFIWHRCDDELPELYKKVLTTDKFGNVIMNMLIKDKNHAAVWIHDYAEMIAWGNVPTPYKGVAVTDG